ncbi:unnamed protein product [Dovyalis caffra]|uniref:COP1-interacting protein 7 n=1 Tax=Dovyalis caffra TaxID=77055 RepID=A0AAV1QZV0_9ROSI|nr:unnamed protein product [Dovyalis caffra]
MKSSTRIDSALFQLTPTRTRCDLIICVNGKTEKIASGLVQPFLDHLKTAQDQVAKGGYSITLEPGRDATWFTKGTIDRFVRFVSTPEVLERVYNLESEILQIEKGIAIQSNNDIGLSSVEDNQAKSVECIEGGRPLTDSSEEKAIVLYKPGSHQPEANGSTVKEGNSKVQLMKALETRKTSLQKEQGMAFARAVAAGFDIDHMAQVMSFAESFGALRLMDACVRFMELWKRKHETGQWVEIEAAEAMSSRSDFSAMNASGIVLSNTINKQWSETPDSNRKAGVGPNAEMLPLYKNEDERPPMDQQPSPGQQEYFQGQFPHPMFPPWPIHSPPGAVPVFPGYPMQGIPYYQNYPGNSPVFQPQYPSGEDPRLNAGQRMRQRRHSMDSNTEPEAWEVDEAELEKETLGGREPEKKGSRSGKKQSGMVVIRNINYITSKRKESSGSESQSASGSENDEEDEILSDTTMNANHTNSLRSSKRKGSHTKSMDKLNSSDMSGTSYGKVDDGGHWKAFQNYLLKDADEAERAGDQGMFAMEKNVRAKRRQNTMGDDPLVFDGRDPGDNQERDVTDMQKISGNLTHVTKTSKEELLLSRNMGQPNDGRRFANGQMDPQSAEIDGRRGQYRMSANDDFIIHGRENKSGYRSSLSDPLADNGFETAKIDLDRRASNNMDDDSYIVSLRSMSLDQVGTEGRNTIDADSEFQSTVQRTENLSNRSQVKYEPDDLSMMPERGTEKGSISYDPALDYDMQASLHKKNKEVVAGQGSKKSDKDQKSKVITDTSARKKTIGPIRKGKPSKLSPLDEAKARAERLRTFKADLQKMKKEKEEEATKRLEALKLERQKRIAARGSSTAAHSASQQTRKQLPTKLSPSSHRGSKFSDSEPGSSSPLQRFSMKTVSAGSGNSQKVSRSSKLSTATSTAGNRLTRSVSSLSEPKKENSGVTPDSKASIARIRRLSEPKIRSSDHTSSIKPRNTGAVSKPKLSSGAESKKISALMNHDKSKAASLPELKTRITKGHNIVAGNSAAKEIPQKMNESKSISTSESTELKQNGNKISHHSDGDDNPIIEKTVVLECEKPSIPSVHTSEQNIEVQDGHPNNYKVGEKTEALVDYAAIRAPVSPITMDEIDKKHTEHQLPKHPGVHEAASEHASCAEKELPKLSRTHNAEKPYHAPYARVSSMEDPCTENSEYGKAPPTSLQTHSTGTEAIKAHASDLRSSKLEQIPEALEKPLTKESSKGFRRLLKFGRKSHASERNVESDNVSLNGSEADDNAASSSEVHTLKNLISRDETPAAGPNQKSKFSPMSASNSSQLTLLFIDLVVTKIEKLGCSFSPFLIVITLPKQVR